MVIADIESEMIECLDFEEVGSVARAKRFQTRANQWLALRADSASNQSSSLTIGKQYIENLLKRARDYIAANATTTAGGSSSVRFLGAGSNFR